MEDKLNKMGFDRAIMIGVVLSLIYYFLIYNDGSDVKANLLSSQTLLEQKTKELDSMKKTLEDAKRHQEVAAKLGRDLEQVLAAVPQNYSTVELMKLVSTEAKTVGLNILSLSGLEGEAKDPGRNFIPITVSVSLSGTFNQIMMFLSNLTKVGKVILTKDLLLTTASGPAGAANANMSFSTKLEAFRYTDKPVKKGR